MSGSPEDILETARTVYADIPDAFTEQDKIAGVEIIARAILAERNTNAQIHALLYEAMELDGASLDILQIVGSMFDTQPAHATLEQLEAFIEREKAR